MCNKIDISVIVPVYNVEDYLEECLDSLLRQGDVNLEVIMIDDGSTDSSGEIADRYACKYDNFFCHHIKNQGLGHARNYAVTYARGKYIAFLDSDDIIPDYTYYKMFLVAEKNGAELTICNVARFNSTGVSPSPLHRKVFLKYEETTHITNNHNLINDTISCNKLIRRDFYARNQFAFPENILYEDIPVTIPMHVLCNKVAMVKEIGYLWRVRDGASKSITQQTQSMKNLEDRIEILRRLDVFFRENVDDEDLNLEKQYKCLDVDLKIFVNVCASLTEQDAYKMIDRINEYIDEAIDERAFEKLAIIDKQKYSFVRNRDLRGLLGFLNYKGYYSEPIEEKNGKLLIDLPEEYFTIADRDITEEFKRYPPNISLGKITVTDEEIKMVGYLYWRRLNIRLGQQDIRIFLSDYKKRIELKVEPHKSRVITKKNGPTIAQYSQKVSKYNLDGAGFVFSIGIKDIINNNIDEGLYHFEVEYRNRIFEGCDILKGISAGRRIKLNETRILNEEKSARLFITDAEEMNIWVESQPLIATRVKKDGNKIVFLTNHNLKYGELRESSQDGEKKQLETIDDNTYGIDVSKLQKDTKYYIASAAEGKENNVYSLTEELFHTGENPFVLVRSNKTKKTNIVIKDSFTIIDNIKLDKDRASILAKKMGVDTNFKSSLRLARIVAEDKYSEEELCLSETRIFETDENNSNMIFDIDFTKKAIDKRLYSGRRKVYIEYHFSNGSSVREQIFCKNVHYKVKLKGITAELFSDDNARLTLRSTRFWPENQLSGTSRNILIKKKYPEYMKAPIVKTRILFEASWGDKYSCNPRAIYEYIDKNYPEYECIWALNDDRIPINGKGKRVRRGTLKYYYYLATSKYLVNNVNFPQTYIKRDGQIEIQTMHGTPLKTLGMDVADEMQNQQIIDNFIERNSRWDYLITQGRFVEEKAYQMFRVHPQILKTGYPRTDHLMNASKKDLQDIKSKLGLPSEKKIILYAPTWRTRNHFDMNLDIEFMREALSNDYILLVRIHHFSAKGYDIPEDKEFVFDVNNYSSIEDLYLISDVLITDYSSSMFDFALLDKPMIFFTYDMDEYCNNLRGLYVDFRKESPGPICMTTEEVVYAITNTDDITKKYDERVAAFKEKFLTYETNNSSELVVKQAIRPSALRHNLFSIDKWLRKTSPIRILRRLIKGKK